MTNTTRWLIVMFAIMFFLFASEQALAKVAQCVTSGTVTRCLMPDGTIVTMINR